MKIFTDWNAAILAVSQQNAGDKLFSKEILQ